MDPAAISDAASNVSQCDKHALTDFYGWMIQGLLAGLAFTCLIGKYLCNICNWRTRRKPLRRHRWQERMIDACLTPTSAKLMCANLFMCWFDKRLGRRRGYQYNAAYPHSSVTFYVVKYTWLSPIFTVKRFFEPKYVRRSWETWWYDTSKQGIGAMVIHMTNVYLAPLFQGDPCTW